MRLSKLKLAGFKTFVDPTTVLIPGNLVGVVGPNGCGKSNIIDAVRWVLGETRASALRGESMQDVIFNGSTTRKPVSRASVELVFDNSDGKAAGQWSRYAEISVKRVLERSGESTYYINNVHVRRKDVIDLFLGTGLGPRAYAIIEQGMISRIIEARPEEVRGFLEEAAGVTKYRERRKETEGRLADARDNLTRLEDIRTELGARIERLRAQAEVAERYRKLSAAHSERQQLLWLLKRNEARAQQDRLRQALDEATRRIETDSARLQALEAAVDEARQAHFAAAEAAHAAQSDLYAAAAEVTRLEAELKHLQDARQRLQARLDQLDAELAHWQGRRQTLAVERDRWAELQENAAIRAEQAEARHAEIADRLPEAEAARQAADTTVSAARRELSQTEQQLRVQEAHRASASRALEALTQRRARLESEGASIDGPDEAVLSEREAKVEALREALDARQQALQALQAAQPDVQTALKAALEHERQAQRQLTELRARHDALVQLQTRVACQGGLGDWLHRHGLIDLTPLWRAVRVAEGWELALEAVLRERLAALRTDDFDAARALVEQPPPGALALVLDSHQSAPLPPAAAPAGSTPLWARIEVLDPAFKPALLTWLQGVFAVDDLDEWLVRRGELADGIALVSRRGQLLTRRCLTHYVPDDRTHGVMERQREIDALTDRVHTLEQASGCAHEALLAAEARAQDLQTRITALRRDTQALQQQWHDAQVELLKLTQARTRALERRQQIDRDLADLARQEDTEREHLARAELEYARAAELAEVQRQRLESAVAVLDERDQALRNTRALEQATARELQEARFSERECSGKLEDIARNLQLAAEQLERIRAEAELRRRELDAIDLCRSQSALQEALALRTGREAALGARRDAQEEAAARLKQLEEMRLRTEQETAPVREQVAELRLAVQAAELATAQFDARLAEAGAIEAALAPLLTEELREAALQREVARLAREIAELGAVNLAALDELKQAEERKGYLDAQADDLNQAIGTLEDAIRRIDRETREQLQDTYNTVNGHFGTLFPQLFGGGQARLELTGEEILDAGIQIVAQPPGKKNSSIHLLSGGEKALTAIALVFSMFQLNPAPFCMLDEVDAPLDDTNTERYGRMVKRMSSQTQFIFITHSKITMEIAQQLVGVTMQEQGVSRVVEVDIDEALRMAESVTA
ncbi:chromosome segregation protein SMC [Zoogloeaceae bacteirum Par-f-2]|nr:chromosome segregation protein SMC [Zoogloeaceae bacteirum Par-f-2]